MVRGVSKRELPPMERGEACAKSMGGNGDGESPATPFFDFAIRIGLRFIKTIPPAQEKQCP